MQLPANYEPASYDVTKLREYVSKLGGIRRWFVPKNLKDALAKYNPNSHQDTDAIAVYNAFFSAKGIRAWLGKVFLSGLRAFANAPMTQAVKKLDTITPENFVELSSKEKTRVAKNITENTPNNASVAKQDAKEKNSAAPAPLSTTSINSPDNNSQTDRPKGETPNKDETAVIGEQKSHVAPAAEPEESVVHQSPIEPDKDAKANARIDFLIGLDKQPSTQDSAKTSKGKASAYFDLIRSAWKDYTSNSANSQAAKNLYGNKDKVGSIVYIFENHPEPSNGGRVIESLQVILKFISANPESGFATRLKKSLALDGITLEHLEERKDVISRAGSMGTLISRAGSTATLTSRASSTVRSENNSAERSSTERSGQEPTNAKPG